MAGIIRDMHIAYITSTFGYLYPNLCVRTAWTAADGRAAKRFRTGRSPEIPTRIWERRINKVKFRHLEFIDQLHQPQQQPAPIKTSESAREPRSYAVAAAYSTKGHHNPGSPHPPVAPTTNFDLSSVAATTDLAAADDHKSGSDEWLRQPPFSNQHRFTLLVSPSTYHRLTFLAWILPTLSLIDFFRSSPTCHWSAPLAPP